MKDSAFRDYYKRILAVLPLVVILSVLLSGCVKKYYQSDIKSYAKKLTGRSNLSVSEGYVEIQEDEEGYELSERETEVLVLLAKGCSSKEIADKLNISIHTVNTHRKNITRKTGIKSVAGLAVYALLHNLVVG